MVSLRAWLPSISGLPDERHGETSWEGSLNMPQAHQGRKTAGSAVPRFGHHLTDRKRSVHDCNAMHRGGMLGAHSERPTDRSSANETSELPPIHAIPRIELKRPDYQMSHAALKLLHRDWTALARSRLRPVPLRAIFCQCVTKSGDPTRTRACISSAGKARRPSTHCPRLFATWACGRVAQRAKSNDCACPTARLLTEQGFVVVYAPVAQLQLEAIGGTHALHPANTDCPQCKGTGRGDKACALCGGR